MGREGRGREREADDREKGTAKGKSSLNDDSRPVLIGPPQDHFGWVTEIGVCHGDLMTSKVVDAESDDVIGSIVSHQTLMTFPHERTSQFPHSATMDKPAVSEWGELQSLLLLDFHIAFLYSHRLIVVSRLRDRVVMEVPFEVERLFTRSSKNISFE